MNWRTALALLALIGFGFGCIEIGKDLKQGQWDADNLTKAEKRAAEVAQADADLQAKNDQIHKQAQEHADEVRAINTRLADALERLRKRPERMPESSRSACAGATGAELSGPDAGFLSREAARAEGIRSALKECYAWIDKATSQ